MKPTVSEKEILPCPFCGGKAKVGSYIKGLPVTLIKCKKCSAVVSFNDPMANYGKAINGDDSAALMMWNTRANDKESYEAGKRDAQSEIDAACAECEAQQERELEEAQKERTCTMEDAYCSSCGKPDPSSGDALFCAYCGAKVMGE